MKIKNSLTVTLTEEDLRELIIAKVVQDVNEIDLDRLQIYFFNKQGQSVDIKEVLAKTDKEVDV